MNDPEHNDAIRMRFVDKNVSRSANAFFARSRRPARSACVETPEPLSGAFDAFKQKQRNARIGVVFGNR